MISIHIRVHRLPAPFSVALIVFLLLPVQSFSQSAFYEGKTVTLVVGTSPGGTGDIRRRAVLSFLRKYIPGNPTIVTEYIPGAGGRKAANYLYRIARPDGLTIGALSGSIVANAVLGQPGIQYDIDRFIYLGATNSANHSVFMVDQRLGLSSVEKLRTHSGLRIGAQEIGHTSYINARLFAWILGLKDPRFVTGYSGPEVDVALLQREVDARALAAASLLRRNPEWVERKEVVDIPAIIEIPKGEKIPRLAHVPDLEIFAKRDVERQILTMQRALQGIGSPYILPPGTPGERAKILQEAFRNTFADPNFLKEYEKAVVEDAGPLMVEELQKLVREIPRNPELIEVFKKISGGEPLPR